MIMLAKGNNLDVLLTSIILQLPKTKNISQVKRKKDVSASRSLSERDIILAPALYINRYPDEAVRPKRRLHRA